MYKSLALFFSILILAACQAPRSRPEIATTSTIAQKCYFVWASRPLPDLSEKIQTAFTEAGQEGISVIAEAYGENCNDAQTNTPVSFGTLETDFRITARVADLKDKDDLGKTLEKILEVLDAFPIGKVPGSEPGTIAISFHDGKDELNIMFSVTAGKSARTMGLHGAALLEKLQKK